MKPYWSSHPDSVLEEPRLPGENLLELDSPKEPCKPLPPALPPARGDAPTADEIAGLELPVVEEERRRRARLRRAEDAAQPDPAKAAAKRLGIRPAEVASVTRDRKSGDVVVELKRFSHYKYRLVDAGNPDGAGRSGVLVEGDVGPWDKRFTPRPTKKQLRERKRAERDAVAAKAQAEADAVQKAADTATFLEVISSDQTKALRTAFTALYAEHAAVAGQPHSLDPATLSGVWKALQRSAGEDARAWRDTQPPPPPNPAEVRYYLATYRWATAVLAGDNAGVRAAAALDGRVGAFRPELAEVERNGAAKWLRARGIDPGEAV